MDLLFLGTGAPDWYKARDFIRHKTALLINEDLLIDPGPDVPAMMRAFGADFSKVRWILVSHSHGDHYDPQTLTFFPDAAVCGADTFGTVDPVPPHFTQLDAGKAVQIGPYRVLPVPANHYGLRTALHFSIRDASGKSFFYGHDGVWFTAEEFALLCADCKKEGPFDGMSFDSTTNGMGANGETAFFDRFEEDEVGKLELMSHNNAAMTIALRDVCRDVGIAGTDTVCFCNHLAWHGYPDMETAQKVFEPRGFTVPYDGFRMTI